MKQVFQMFASFFVTFLTYIFGKMDMALITLLVVVGIDLLSGLAKAYVLGNLNATKGMKGLIKKISYLSIVAVAVIVDQLCKSGDVIRTFVIYYFVINECLSILENAVAMKLPIPKILVDKLEQLKADADSKT